MLLSMADVDVQKIPQEISNKYVLENNTLSKSVVTDIEKKIDIEIGDSKQKDFKPQVKTLFFDNEYNVSVRAEEKAGSTVELEGEKVKYITDEYEVHLYDKPNAGENGGHEIEWLLPKKPTSNILKATLVYKGNVRFCYQGELTQKEINDGANRPENVVGSYAVYIDKSNYKLGDKNYATGKIEHIYRPQAIDSKGNKTWCELYIPETGQADTPINITVTIPQKFLDEAVYPVIVDPTIGYTTQGASTIENGSGYFSGYNVTTPSGTINISKVSAYLKKETGATAYYKGLIALLSNGNIATNGISNEKEVTSTSSTLEDSNFSNVPTISASTNYVLGFSATSSGGDEGFVFINYDNDVSVNFYVAICSYSAPSSPLTLDNSGGNHYKLSLYATYTEGVASSIKKIMGVAIASVKKVSGLAIASVKKVMGVANG